MTASAVTHYAFVPVHVETSTTTTHAELANHVKAHAKVHVAATTHHSTASNAKSPHAPAHQQAKSGARSSLHVTPRDLIDLVKSPLAKKTWKAGGGPVPGALTPAQVAGAYGVTALGLANQGQGQTIGIIDEFHDPNILADTNAFSTQYGLQNFNVAGGPTLTIHKDTTFGPVPNAPFNSTGPETSLDVEWAHAMAPKANILLVEVPSGNDLPTIFKELLEGVQYAAANGASVVSLSYGYIETQIGLPALYSLDHTYLANGAASNVAVTVSSGDTSYPGFPSSSPNVLSVGGTQLHVTGSNGYGSEAAWGGVLYDGAGGGGPGAFFKSPAFQVNNGISYGRYRTLPDVALLADPISAASVYDSYDANGGSAWTAYGGTSLASPLFAGMLSIAQQQRVAAGKPILNSVQINNSLYAAYKSPSYLTYFHDITGGNNSDSYDGYAGYSTSTGYDLATGLGSPIANALVPYLAGL